MADNVLQFRRKKDSTAAARAARYRARKKKAPQKASKKRGRKPVAPDKTTGKTAATRKAKLRNKRDAFWDADRTASFVGNRNIIKYLVTPIRVTPESRQTDVKTTATPASVTPTVTPDASESSVSSSPDTRSWRRNREADAEVPREASAASPNSTPPDSRPAMEAEAPPKPPPLGEPERLRRFRSHDARPPDEPRDDRHNTRAPDNLRYGDGGGGIAGNGHFDGMALALYVAAVVLTCFGVTLAIQGFRVLLPGWEMYAAGLATALEFTRLLAIGYFSREWRELGLLIGGLMAFVILLGEGVSLVGGYSELQNLHQGNRPSMAAAAATGMAGAGAQVEYQRGIVSDLDKQIANLDTNTTRAVEAAGRRRNTGGRDARDQMNTTDRQRGPLAGQRQAAAQKLAQLQEEAARAAGAVAVVDAETGPVRQLAAILNVPAEVASRYWLLAITILVGPAAGILVAAAARRGRRRS